LKKRVLFVDDEPLVLQGLQRMLRPMRNDWEMDFVPSGALALQRMAQTPFDIVVSDMCMPGMNGAQLLTEVMKRYPKTVRLILSGHADKDLVLKCIGSTHQYLAKPCEPEVLKATITRASALDLSLSSGTLKNLVAQMDHLPSLPSLYLEIVEKLNQPDVDLEEVGRIIGQDVGMTAQVLKLVNSAFFGLRRQLANASEAVTYLGGETMKSLVLSIHAFSQFDRADLGEFSLDKLRSHSTEVAAAAKAIALAEGADAKVVDEAFVSGMLHDIGKLVLLSNFGKPYREVFRLENEKHVDASAAEQQVFGANHADIGGYLLGLWGLPVPVVEAIAMHHSPRGSTQKSFTPLTAVHVAEALVHRPEANGAAVPPDRLDAQYLAELGLSGRFDAWRQSCQNHS